MPQHASLAPVSSSARLWISGKEEEEHEVVIDPSLPVTYSLGTPMPEIMSL